MELSGIKKEFEALGFKVYVMTYDDHDGAQNFQRKRNTGIPILRDVDREHVDRFGILNEQYAPDSRAYGVPYPGIFLVDNEGVIRAKYAEESYKDRPALEIVLEDARALANEK